MLKPKCKHVIKFKLHKSSKTALESEGNYLAVQMPLFISPVGDSPVIEEEDDGENDFL